VFGEPTVDARRLLVLIEYLPMDSATSGALLGAAPGWSSQDELRLSLLNQAILQRRMWATPDTGKALTPIQMPWHKAASKPSTVQDIRSFFGGGARVAVVKGE
jgi:hypothetical protein